MHNHQQDSPPTAKKPPRPPPLSVSLPDPDPLPEPNKPNYNPNPKPNSDESPHSPLRSESPLRSDDPELPTSYSPPPKNGGGGAIMSVVEKEKYYSPLTSPQPATPPDHNYNNYNNNNNNILPGYSNSNNMQLPTQHVISFNRREEAPPQTGVVYGGGGGRRWRGGFGVRKLGVGPIVGLGLRVLEFVFCLVSFSVMASDKTQGWSGDSFDRYKEYKFCLTVAVMGFVYSGFQAYDLSYHLATGKHVITHHLRHQFDFILDQILAYLLISASSAAAARVDDWQANWGKDEFTEKASASISMAFLAFIAFALSSMISGYNLCTRDLS